ncbi:hypothetical protein MCOR02_011430 [Pyricularia oryzae]|uniref:Zn(2)-C6 fungal-type domain-containing protein n=3 Tax=Pyricularia TaxID=48558 RepID=A0ABQ8NWY0_PYRGI|nr:hypothetical protein MCOR02_011430 [Pyricularia oryzae]KAI6303334.1 hypothetical protein MCOR33_001424 [Pyricularia grisea]KAI6280169.1 hypothetical protein MCOR34_011189 [Pyricularia oryzae]KAI6341046.1 hypothetical protein MCOR30_002270 [Pyricularia oryzae]KAI6383695.1 hypothetical protein MCOR32_002605 [Pyricularia oryzae]
MSPVEGTAEPVAVNGDGDGGAATTAATPAASAAASAPPPVARRRTHRKSRHGCAYCKGRRIKCDELRPACSNCVIRGLVCSLSATVAPATDGNGSGNDGNGPLSSTSEVGPLSSLIDSSPAAPVQQLPLPPLPPTTVRSPPQRRSFGLFPLATRNLGALAMAATSPHAALEQHSASVTPTAPHQQQLPPASPYQQTPYTSISSGLPMMTGGLDYDDLHLLHHFVTFTSKTFGNAHIIQRFWATTAPEVGFQHHFVLHAILAVAGLHLAQLSVPNSAKRQHIRRKVDHHWDVSLRLATPLLGDLNADNCDALNVFTGLTCIYIFARGPQAGSYLLFDAESPVGGEGSAETLIANGALNGDGMTDGSAVAAAATRGISTTEEWLVFFRGLRSVMKATETARRARKGRSMSSVSDDQPWGLMDQMFGPDDVMTEEDLDELHGEDQVMSEPDVEQRLMHDGSSERRSSMASGSHQSYYRRRRDPLADGGFATRSTPMKDLRDVIRQQIRADDPDREVYASAFAELAASYATVFEKDMSTRQTSAQVVFGWMYHISDDFIERVKARHPVALAIFAHFVVLLSVLELKWTTKGWPEHLLSGIYDALGAAGRLWIRWPMERVGWLPG